MGVWAVERSMKHWWTLAFCYLRTRGSAGLIRPVSAIAVIVVDVPNGDDARSVETGESLEIRIVERALHEGNAARHEG